MWRTKSSCEQLASVKQLWSRQNMHMCSMHSLPLRLSWTCSETERRPGRSNDHLFNAHTMYMYRVHVIIYLTVHEKQLDRGPPHVCLCDCTKAWFFTAHACMLMQIPLKYYSPRSQAFPLSYKYMLNFKTLG